jgi:hypothetical protein
MTGGAELTIVRGLREHELHAVLSFEPVEWGVLDRHDVYSCLPTSHALLPYLHGLATEPSGSTLMEDDFDFV